VPPAERVAVLDGEVITKHFARDDSDVKVLLGGILQAFAGVDVEEYQAAAHAFLHSGQHPTLGRGFSQGSGSVVWVRRRSCAGATQRGLRELPAGVSRWGVGAVPGGEDLVAQEAVRPSSRSASVSCGSRCPSQRARRRCRSP
jgi:hypothetical protein